MRVFVLFMAILLLGFAAHYFLPWWAVCGVALVVSAIAGLRPAPSFTAGFLAGALIWGSMAAWLHSRGDGLLAGRIGELLGGIGAPALIALTALLGGLLGGFGALTGSLGRRLRPAEAS